MKNAFIFLFCTLCFGVLLVAANGAPPAASGTFRGEPRISVMASVPAPLEGFVASDPGAMLFKLLASDVASFAATTSNKFDLAKSLLASANFDIPARPPDTTITARSMYVQSGTIKLEVDVKAVRDLDVLTCQVAYLHQNPDWMLASKTPQLSRKEAVPPQKLNRESNLNAENILWRTDTAEIEASPAVSLQIDEFTWDNATHTWYLIGADRMVGNRRTSHLQFFGNVSIRDKTGFGQGMHLDYDRASATVTLSGSAYLEREKYSEKEKKMVKEMLTGDKIIYHLDTKQATSE